DWAPERHITSSIIQASESFADSIAYCRCLRIVNAMARKWDFNAPLESLGLPNECLIDPFDGERLRVKQTPDGPIVYSVDSNFIDDGGKINQLGTQFDIGFGPIPRAKK